MNIPDGYRLLEKHETIVMGDRCDYDPFSHFTPVHDSIGTTPETWVTTGMKWITQRPKPEKEWVNPWD